MSGSPDTTPRHTPPPEHTGVLCIGSNDPRADRLIGRALDMLSDLCELTALSDRYRVSEPYLNQVAAFSTGLDADAMARAAKDIEAALGRDAAARRSGRVPVDIDIVIWDGSVLREADYSAPWFGPGYARIRNDATHTS